MTTVAMGELFAGYGGLGLGVEAALNALGFKVERAFVSDIEPGPCAVLAHHWPDVPNLGDITAVDWWTAPRVDVLTGGVPCQDVSTAGRQAGLAPGTRSGLWSEFARAIAVLRPGLVVIENVRGLLSATASRGDAAGDLVEPCPICMDDGGGGDLRALGAVLGDLLALGFDAEWGMLAAADVGAAHRRERVFIVAWPAADACGGEPERRRIARELGSAAVAHEGARRERERVRHAPVGSGAAARLMPTPEANLGTRGGAQDPVKRREGGHSVSLADAVHVLLPTPSVADTQGGRKSRSGARSGEQRFGEYSDAVARWASVVGRSAPDATERSPQWHRWRGMVARRRRREDPRPVGMRGSLREPPSVLSPLFVEWMMGLPEGHVTDVPGLKRPAQLRLLGNGVVPQQAAYAVRSLLRRSVEGARPVEWGAA